SRASGNGTAITIAATHGRNSATKATDLACRQGARDARRNASGSESGARLRRLARPSGRPARGRPAHGGGRLPSATQLFAGVGPGGPQARPHRGTAGGGRGLPLSGRRAPAG